MPTTGGSRTTVKTPLEASSRPALRGVCVAASFATLLSTMWVANADSPSGTPFDDAVSANSAVFGFRSAVARQVGQAGCWDDAPPYISFVCYAPEPEGDEHVLVLVLYGRFGNVVTASSDQVFTYETVDITAKDGLDYTGSSGRLTIKAGASSTAAVFFPLLDDALDEHDEVFAIRSRSLVGAALEAGYAVMPIADNDPPAQMSIADAAGQESDGSLSFKVTLNVPSGKTIAVNYATADGTATAEADYRTTTGTLTLAPGDTEGAISIPIVDDGVAESDETFTVTLSNPVDVDVVDGTATGMIEDTGFMPMVSVASEEGVEDTVGSLEFAVTLNGPGVVETAVAYATADATATAGSDYTAANGMLTFAAGETSKTVRVPVLTDTLPEEDETFAVTLSSPVQLFIAADNATGTIRDDDAVLAVAGARARESEGPLAFAVTLRGGASVRGTVTVDYATSAREAHAGSDYVTTEGTLTFAPGTGAHTIEVPLVDDEVHEGNETFVVVLRDPVNAVFEDFVAEGAIVDDDKASARIVLAADPSRVREDAGETAVAVTAALDASAREVATTVTVSAAASGAPDAVGFAAVPDFAIMIAAGETSGTGTFALTPENDLQDEADETIAVTGASDLPVTRTEVELVDDEVSSAGITLSADPSRVLEDEGETAVTVTAALDGSSRTGETTVTVSVAGSGTPGVVGFAAVPDFAITIAAGETSGAGTFALTPEDNFTDEQDEELSLTGASDLPVTGTTVALVDDDLASTRIELEAVPPLVREDTLETEVTVTATLDASGRPVATTVTVTAAGSGKPDAVDFEAVADFAITIAAGETSGTATFKLLPEDDAVDEVDEKLSLDATSDLPVTGAEVVIVDDDETSSAIRLTAQPSRVSEGAGETAVSTTATLDAGARSTPTTVTVTVTGSGTPGVVGFAAVPDFAITIAAGETSGTGTFALTPEDDLVDEVDEELSLDATSDLPVTGAEVVIVDDDETSSAIRLTAQPSRVSEGAGETAVSTTATLDAGARSTPTTVTVTVTGSGTPGVVGFAAVPDFAITIAAGETSGTGTFALTPEDDLQDEADEELSLDGTSDLSVTGATVMLADNDEPSTRVVLSAVPSSVSEGAGATDVAVTATLDAGARTVATTVAVTVSGSGVPEAVDFAEVADFTITIAAGETSGAGKFTLAPENDNVAGSNETLDVAGSADLAVTDTTVTIADDDTPSTGIVLARTPVLVSEGGGPVQVEVTAALNGAGRQVSTTVAVSVAGSGDPAAVDFDPVADFTITIAAGESSGTNTFTLTPVDDLVAEVDETLKIEGTADLPVTGTTVTLVDDEKPSIRVDLSAVPASVSENAGATAVEVTATLDAGARTVATTVAVTVSGSGVPGAADFSAVPDFAITIAAGATSGAGAFTVDPEDDAVVESDETLTVSGVSDLPVAGASVSLVDDDEESTRILLSAVPGRVSEGAGRTPVVVTAMLDRGLRQSPTTVAVSVVGSGDPSAAAFEPVPDFAVVIAAGASSGTATFTLDPEDDAVVESDETLTVSGTSDLPVTSATVALADDDEPSTRILLSAAPGRVSEDAGPTAVVVTATLDRGLRQAATRVTVTVAGSGDPDSVDFAAVPDFTVTIPARAASGAGTFTLTPEDDRNVETDETLAVTGSSDLPVTGTSATLADDDEESTRILLFLAVDPPQASEGGGPVRVTVTATVDRGVRPESTRVEVSVAGSGNADAVDFETVSDFGIVIPANALRGAGSFTVVPEDDAVVEQDEVLRVTGVSDLPVTSASLTLLDDDEALIVLSANPRRVSEGDGPVAVTVTATLTGALLQEATAVSVSVTASGAPDAVDFDPVPDFEIAIPAAMSGASGTFTLDPEDDAVDEADETLTVSGVAEQAVVPTSVTLADDDETVPALRVSDAVGNESDGELSFAVSMDEPGRTAVTVGYASADGTAVAGSDYEAAAGMLVFAPGELSKTVRVTVVDDLLDEPDETFALTLSAPANATLARGSALGTILDDDEPPALSVADAAGGEDVGALAFAVTLDEPSALPVSASYATADGTATAGVDYEAASGTLVFAPGEVAKTIRVPVLDDTQGEAEETFALTLSAPANATLARASALGTIRDDDEPPALSVADAAGGEDVGALAFAVTLDEPSALPVSASYATADGTATAGVDYEAASGTLVFAPGEVAKTIRVPVLDDTQSEAEETFALTLSAPANATLARASALGTIRDDDEPPALSVADAAGGEDVGALAFAVTLDEPSALPVSASYATADGTATAGVDYEATSGTLVFAPGELSKTVRVPVLDDTQGEAEETFALTLSAPANATLARASALGTIRDDDEPPALSVADAAGGEDVGALAFAVTLDEPSALPVSASYATADGTATAGVDYEAASGTLVFAPGELSKTVRVTVVDDLLDEPDETFALTLSAPANATLARASALGTIRDDDEPPALSVADAAGGEDVGALAFAVTLDEPSALPVSASYATADGTATAGVDYEAASGMLVFAPGELSKTVRVTVVDDLLDEPDETFALTLSAPANATLARASALGTIRDDDEPPALSVAGAVGAEDAGGLSFAVTLSAPSPTGATVDYASSDGTALATSDYESVAGTLSFAPGELSKTVRVPVLDDALDEADEETFAVTLSGPSGATVETGSAIGTILDDDEPPALSVADAAGGEDVGALSFAVTLDAPSALPVSASYATADGTATAGSDYEAASGTVAFAPGETGKTIRVAIIDDTMDEADEETFVLALSSPERAVLAEASATGTIRDDDRAPPTAAGPLPTAMLCVGGAAFEVDLGDHFVGEGLSFSAVSSAPEVAPVVLAGSQLTVRPASEGEAAVTVTAANAAGWASGTLSVRVVADPAELAVVDSVLASIGRGILAGVAESVGDRFMERSFGRDAGERGAWTASAGRGPAAGRAVDWNRWRGRPAGPVAGPERGLPGLPAGRGGTPRPPYGAPVGYDGGGIAPFSFSFDAAAGGTGSAGPGWSVWGRGDARRFESGLDGSSHDGTLTGVHLGADARFGDWLAGVSALRSTAEADYRFERSVDACGGGGIGEGVVEAEATSVHPYAGRRLGAGWIWAAAGFGRGDATVKRCGSGALSEADLSLRLAALGGRHPFAQGERIAVSVVEELGVLHLETGGSTGPVGGRSVSVGQARLGVEAAGVAPADCACSLTTFVRALARGDWGDGATGAGLEVAAGVRYRNHLRRFGIDAGVRALAVHSAADVADRSANLTLSVLPKADGTGLQAALAWRRDARDLRLDALGEISPWAARAGGGLPAAGRRWTAAVRLGYGLASRGPAGQGWLATPFLELDAGGLDGARAGVRHAFGNRARGLVVEWGVAQQVGAMGGTHHFVLVASGRF